MPDTTKTKRQDAWASMLGWANPLGWFGAKTAAGVTIQPPGAAAHGSGTIEGRNPYSYVLPGYAGFNGDASMLGSIPGLGNVRWPGTYATYRTMLSHPTVAVAMASIVAPILAGSWFYESDAERADEDAAELLKKTFDPKRQRLLSDAIRCLYLGFQSFEVVWGEDDEGHTVPTAFKPLLPELTTITVDAFGNVAGIENNGAKLKPGEFLLLNYDVEGSNFYGRSRLENIRRVWANYLAIEDQGYLLDKKSAGIIPLIYFPPDTSVPDTNNPNATAGRSNLAAATRIGADIQNGKAIAMENFAGMAPDRPEDAAMLADKSDWKIDTVDIGNVGPSQSAILEKLRYYDSMLIRGLLRPERAVIEAQTAGSRADSESHQSSIADTDCDLVHSSIVEQINRQVVDEMLVQNFGESARGTAWIAPRELVDERRATMDLLLNAALADPMIRGELFERIDMDSLTQWTGIKVKEDAKPWDEMPTQEERQDAEVDKAAAMHEATGGDVAKGKD